jgi:hypothetical protein
LKDVPKKIIKDLKLILVDNMDEVLARALVLETPDMLWNAPRPMLWLRPSTPKCAVP